MGDDLLDGLEERLQSHARAFDSLLALTPARDYYGSQIDDGLDPSEQWNRKKQTKEQKRAAKKAKLDPANQKSALDIMKERENKRKRELGLEEENDADEAKDTTTAADGEDKPTSKRQKQTPEEPLPEDKRAAIAQKRREARERKQEKIAKAKAKLEARKARKQEAAAAETVAKKTSQDDEEESDDEDTQQPQISSNAKDIEKLDLSGLVESDNDGDDVAEDNLNAEEASSVPTSPEPSPAFDIATNHSETSSSSSIVPPAKASTSKKLAQKQQPLPNFQPTLALDTATTKTKSSLPSGTESPKLRLPDIDQAELQERLRKRIDELRARRKADGPDGRPARSRQELLDQRRKKEEQRKANKKELRRQAKEEEARQREAQLRGSGSPLSMELFSSSRPSPRPQDDPSVNNFSFSRVAFADGTAADASLSTLHTATKRKGPSDARTALLAAEKKASRLSGLDSAKRADIAEKDMWLNAKKHAHGERVRDDTSLLKKALKRKEKQKGKSEKQWQERQENVVKGKEMKQKRREANLTKRKEEKGGKGKKGGKGGAAAKGKGKKKGRPGFEGRFKA